MQKLVQKTIHCKQMPAIKQGLQQPWAQGICNMNLAAQASRLHHMQHLTHASQTPAALQGKALPGAAPSPLPPSLQNRSLGVSSSSRGQREGPWSPRAAPPSEWRSRAAAGRCSEPARVEGLSQGWGKR